MPRQLLLVQAEKTDRRWTPTRSGLSRQQSTGHSRIVVAGLCSLEILRSGLIVHWSGYVAACRGGDCIHPPYTRQSHITVSVVPVALFGQSEMPFVPSGTLLMHDKPLLGVLSEMDTEFMEIGAIANSASRHKVFSGPMSPRTPRAASALPQPYTCRYRISSATHAAASIKGINHCWRKLFIEDSQRPFGRQSSHTKLHRLPIVTV
jgi:hypothetical protein